MVMNKWLIAKFQKRPSLAHLMLKASKRLQNKNQSERRDSLWWKRSPHPRSPSPSKRVHFGAGSGRSTPELGDLRSSHDRASTQVDFDDTVEFGNDKSIDSQVGTGT